MNIPATEVNVINRDFSNADINLESPILRVVILSFHRLGALEFDDPPLLPLILSPE